MLDAPMLLAALLVSICAPILAQRAAFALKPPLKATASRQDRPLELAMGSTLTFPILLGAGDVMTGGSWVAWIAINLLVASLWMALIVLLVRRKGKPFQR